MAKTTTVELPMAQAFGWYDGMVYLTQVVQGSTGIPAIGYRERTRPNSRLLMVHEAEAFGLALLAAVKTARSGDTRG